MDEDFENEVLVANGEGALTHAIFNIEHLSSAWSDVNSVHGEEVVHDFLHREQIN